MEGVKRRKEGRKKWQRIRKWRKGLRKRKRIKIKELGDLKAPKINRYNSWRKRDAMKKVGFSAKCGQNETQKGKRVNKK